MAAAEQPVETDNPEMSGALATVTAISPSLDERGFLVGDKSIGLPYDIRITDWDQHVPKYKKGVGQILTSIISMEDISAEQSEDSPKKSRFVLQKIVPDEQIWGVSTDYTPPLATRVKGFNTYLGIQLAKAGIHSRLVGTNQEHGHTLLHDAQATLAILAHDDWEQKEQGDITCEPDQSDFTGYSMGKMKLIAMLGLSSQMGREVGVSIGLDPCLVNGVDYQKELADAPGLVKYLTSEAKEIPVQMRRNIHPRTLIRDLRRARHLVDTVGITPKFISNVRDKWDVLATGETRTFPPNVPEEAVVIIHFFDGCRWNDSSDYDELFGNHPNVRAIHEDGLHLSGADPEVVGRVVDKNVLALKLMDQKVSQKELADALMEPILLPA